MSTFEQYCERYTNIQMRREDGILEMRFHTNGGPLRWNLQAHGELERAFLDVGRDKENQVVIMTGAGDEFSGPAVTPGGHRMSGTMDSAGWDTLYWEGKHLLMNLLNIEVPVISAINGPAARHAEIPVLADIVLASERATIQDSAHFNGGLVPGDGVHVVFPLLMGTNRGRYFLLTSQVLSAREALEAGLVNEVLEPEALLPRAWEHARALLRQSQLVRRYSRVLLTQDIKRRMHDLLGYGLALEGLAASERRS
jgi:enoyl-CoA hydratase/carnithine racemase